MLAYLSRDGLNLHSGQCICINHWRPLKESYKLQTAVKLCGSQIAFGQSSFAKYFYPLISYIFLIEKSFNIVFCAFRKTHIDAHTLQQRYTLYNIFLVFCYMLGSEYKSCFLHLSLSDGSLVDVIDSTSSTANYCLGNCT